MKFRSRVVEIEANQFTHGATAPIGVRTREDGSCYVVTIQGEEVNVHPGDWIILEDPPGDGTRAYPCKSDVFERRYNPTPADPLKMDELMADRNRLAEKAQDEMYLRGNQLAAISTVLMSNTPITLSQTRLPADHALYTAAFQDAVCAVEREIELRQGFREQKGVINVLADRLARYTGATAPDEICKAREVVRRHESGEQAQLGRCRQEGMDANDHNRRIYRSGRGQVKGNPYQVNSEEWKAWRDGYSYRDMVNDG